ncbi:MAG TPA: exonuclease domain-containing protein [Clostridia bacterium]
MEKLIEEIIKINPEYKYLRLNKVTYFAAEDYCKIEYFYPNDEPFLTKAKSSFAEIKKISQQLTGIETYCDFFKVEVKEEHIILSLQTLIKTELNTNNFPSKNIKIELGKISKISISIDELYYDYAITKGLDKQIEQNLSNNFCADFEVELIKKESKEDILDILKPEPLKVVTYTNNRLIFPISVNHFIGKEINEPAVYIKDLNLYCEQEAVVCGTIKGLKRATYKSKKNPESDKEKVYFKFTLEDFTGQVECIFFAHSSSVQKADNLTDGSEIILKGKVEQGKYSLNIVVRSISYCEIPKGLVEVKHRNPVPEKYAVIFPEDIVITEQASFLEKDTVPDEIKKNTYVVFDVETTGIGENDKITELAAVKIKDGKICQLFSTLINPKMKIPPETSKITGITDEMVAQSPTYEEIAGDFYKFCENAILVGHNIVEFDLPFISRYSDTTHYYFDEHKVEDTLIIAREKLKGKLSNYKLTTVAQYFNIVNIMAHRAQFDALTTAKVFLELSKLPG